MKKKLSIVLLSVILALASASAGICFADTITAFPPAGGYFSQVISNKVFFKLDYTLLDGTTVSNPLHVFNDLYAYNVDNSTYRLLYNGYSSGNLSKGYQYFTFIGSVSPFLQVQQSGSFGSNASSGSAPTFNSASLFPSDLGLSLGDSVEWSESGAVSNTYRLSLPYGNVLRVYSDSDFTITSRAYSVHDTTYNYQKYVRASDNFSYRVNGSYQGVVSNSSLVGTFGPAVFGSDNVMSLLIPWQPTNQNVLGRATDYNYYNGSPDPTANVSVSSSQSFLIWYPYYANNQDTTKINEVPIDVSLTIESSGSISFMTYPITGSTSSSGEDAYISNTASASDAGSSQQSSGSDGDITVTFDNAPSAGGNHGQAPINQNNSILGVLSNLQNTLLGLFNKAIDGIHNLIALGSDFLQSVQIMFSWLPAELLVIITSGFVILLTIGVLKTLWR